MCGASLLRDIKTTNVFHHPLKAKIIFTFYIINQVSDLIAHIIAHFHVI